MFLFFCWILPFFHVIIRRDSFITHRAFCDALAEESAKSIATANLHHPLLLSSQNTTQTAGSASKLQPFLNLQAQPHPFNTSLMTYNDHHAHSMKQEQQSFSSSPMNQLGPQLQAPLINPHHHFNLDPNPNPSSAVLGGPIHLLGGLMKSTTGSNSSPHMSATALLQKAAQMGATMSSINSTSDSTAMIMPHHQAHVTANTTTGFGLHLSSRDQHQLSTGLLSSFANKAAAPPPTADQYHQVSSANSFLQDMMMSQGFVDVHQVPHQTFDHDYAFTTPAALLNQKKDHDQECYINEDQFRKRATPNHRPNDHLVGITGNDEGMTRDFLGLRPLSHAEILRITALQGEYNANPTANDHPDHHD